jgi:hypothetical protein
MVDADLYSMYMTATVEAVYTAFTWNATADADMHSVANECRATFAIRADMIARRIMYTIYNVYRVLMYKNTISCKALLRVLACTSHFVWSLIPHDATRQRAFSFGIV